MSAHLLLDASIEWLLRMNSDVWKSELSVFVPLKMLIWNCIRIHF
jgi:hypothetical protein